MLKLFRKKNDLESIIKRKIEDIITQNLKINYMILTKRTLLVTEKLFTDIYSRFILDNALIDTKLTQLQNKHLWWKSWNVFLQDLKNKIEWKDVSFIFNIRLPQWFIKKAFNVVYIDSDYEKTWKELELAWKNFDTITKDLEVKYTLLDSASFNKIIENIKLLYKLSNYQNTKFEVKESFVIIEETDYQYCFTTRDNIFLANIKQFSYFIKDRRKYKIIIISESHFNELKTEIENYKSNKIYGLADVKNPFLTTWLVNNMTNYDWWDFNLTYFYWDEYNPHKINCSVRLNWKYKIINYKNIKDFDLNVLDSDIITLGWKLLWVVTVTNLKVWRFSFRVLIIRKNWIYFLNIRKTEWVPYTLQELNEKSMANFGRFQLIEWKKNRNISLDVNFQLKHFDIDFPLWYSEWDSKVFFDKLVSSTKWTFWINGKTNSWKSTSLKNLLKQFYDYSREMGTNKKILMIENPIEWYDYYFKQIEVDDEDIEDYKAITMWVKRADLDMCVYWELRTYDVFWIFNETSNSLPVFSTFHVWTAESFLSMLKYYSDKAWLNYLDVLGNVNVSLVQVPLQTERETEIENKDMYKKDEIEELLLWMYWRFRLNEEELSEEEEDFKKLLWDIVNIAYDQGKTILKSHTSKARPMLYYEILTWDMLWLFLNKKETNFSKIYKYLWYTNNTLYKTFKVFLNWNMLFDNVKIDEYSHDVKINTLEKIKEDLLAKKL